MASRLQNRFSAEELADLERLCMEENIAKARKIKRVADDLSEAERAEITRAHVRPFAYWLEDFDGDPSRVAAWRAAHKSAPAQPPQGASPPPPPAPAQPVAPPAGTSASPPAAAQAPFEGRVAAAYANPNVAIGPDGKPVAPAAPRNDLIAYPGEARGRYSSDGGPNWEFLRTTRNVGLVWDRLHGGTQLVVNMTNALKALAESGFTGDKSPLQPNVGHMNNAPATPAFLQFCRGLTEQQWIRVAHVCGRATEKGNVIMKDREVRT